MLRYGLSGVGEGAYLEAIWLLQSGDRKWYPGRVEKKRRSGFRVQVDHEAAFGIKVAQTISRLQYGIVSRAPNQEKLSVSVKAYVADRLGSDNLVVHHGMKEAR